MIITLLAAGAPLFMSALPAEETATYFSTDFEQGLPDAVSTYDLDGAPLHFTMVQAGFDATDTWRVLTEWNGLTENRYVASASRHKKSDDGTIAAADDWMVIGPVWIRGSEATLTWEAKTILETLENGSSYAIYVSEEGPIPSSFTSSPVWSTEEEPSGDWTSHEASLSPWEGKHVYIAFVNISMQSEILAIDNISISGGKGLAEITVYPDDYALGTEPVAFSATLTATSYTPLTDATLTLNLFGENFQQTLSGLNLSRGESVTVTFDDAKVDTRLGEYIPFSLLATVNGQQFDIIEKNPLVLAFLPQKKIVVEEHTGMWCGYCPGGIFAMEWLEENYPDNFIGIAVHSQDNLEFDGYDTYTFFPKGAPTAWVDRAAYSINPVVETRIDGKKSYTPLAGGLATDFINRLERLPLSEIRVDARLDGKKVEIDSEFRSAVNVDNADLRIAYVITEDNVWYPGCYQTNYYSGSTSPIGGFENLSESIKYDDGTDFSFRHVARDLVGGIDGFEGSIPASLTAGEAYAHSITAPLPSNVRNADNLHIVAMVIDNATGEIVAGDSSTIGMAGVDDIRTAPQWNVRTAKGALIVDNASDRQVDIHNLAGVRVKTVSRHSNSEVAVAPGIYTVSCAGESLKVIVE